MKRIFSVLIASGAVAALAAPADATLTRIGTATYESSSYSLIYDDAPALVWLDYSNDNGENTWQSQMDWAAGLNGSGVLAQSILPGFDVTWTGSWKLPDTNPATDEYEYGEDGTTSAGYNITSSEMGDLYYNALGNLGFFGTNGDYQDGWGLMNTGLFVNLLDSVYWSATSYAPDDDAWNFYMSDGYQDEGWKEYGYYGLAVRSAQVSQAQASSTQTSSVPEPGTMMLMASGLAGLFFARRKFSGTNM